MGKIKVTLPLILSAFLCSLLILILILVSIGFRNSDSGQPENSNPNFNQNLKETSEEPAQTGENGHPDSDPQSITSCSVAMEILPSPRSQKQWIHPHGNSTKVEVLCDFQVDGGGWTVIQKRSSGPLQDFNRTWDEYSKGFGSLDGNFWLGLENIHALTKNGDQELRIELQDFEGNKSFAKYSSFSVSDSSDFYRLKISGFSRDSTAGDSMTKDSSNNGARFTTWDKDNDDWGGNCAHGYFGSWWFSRSCGYSNLNGIYLESGASGAQGVLWESWKGFRQSLAKTEIKIRTKKPESQ